MTNTITLEEARNHISTTIEDTEVVPFAFEQIKAHTRQDLEISGKNYGLTDAAQKQFAEAISVPFPFVKRSPSQLVALNYNYLIGETPQRALNAVIRGGKISSFCDVNIPHVDHLDVLEAAVNEVGDDAYLRNFRIDDSGLLSTVITSDELNFFTDETPYFGGVKVKFSDTWAVHPVVEAYLEREWCTNGATSQIDKRKFRVKGYSRDAIIEQFAEFAGIAKGQINPMFQGFVHLRDEMVDNVRNTILRICQEHKLPDKVFNRIMEYWGTDGFKSTFTNPEHLVQQPTMYHVVNLFTYVGTHCSDLAPEHRELLMAIGGTNAINHHDRCGSCGSRV